MPIKYTHWYYIYPPRPTGESKYQSEGYRKLQGMGTWIAQPKLRGQRNLVCISPEGKVEFWNRHKGTHRNYTVPQALCDEIRQAVKCQAGAWTILDSELIHAKVKGGKIKNTIYVWDVLVHNGSYLTGTTYQERYQLVRQILGISPDARIQDFYLEVSDHLWLAINLPSDQWDSWWEANVINSEYVEGYVIKNPQAKLMPGINEQNNDAWNIRCRKPFSSGPTGNRTLPGS